MTKQLPKVLDPIKFAKQAIQLEGYILLTDCSRLQAICDQSGHEAQAMLQFGQDQSRLYFVKGQIKTRMKVICQRCNSPMEVEIEISFALSPVTTEARMKNLPDCYEPLMLEDESVSVIDMIEDEILLNLPMVPKHAEGECPVPLPGYLV